MKIFPYIIKHHNTALLNTIIINLLILHGESWRIHETMKKGKNKNKEKQNKTNFLQSQLG